jgi:methyl-accepting chemotaxis protein
MNWFRDLPIRRKLMTVMLLGSTISLLLACSAFVAYELRTFQQTMERDMVVLANVLGQNSTGAFAFDDPAKATETLASLQSEPRVLTAALFKDRTNRFAGYTRAGSGSPLPEEAPADGTHAAGDVLEVGRPVLLNGERIGSIALQADLSAIRERIQRYLGIALLVLLGSTLLAIALSTPLQRAVSNPILALARTAKIISEKKDYSVRAADHGEDEIGQLNEAFNQMLSEIERGQNALQRAHESLLRQTGQIMESVGVLSTSARQILDFSVQVASSATETATAVTQTTTTVEEARQTALLSAQKARAVADTSQRAAQISQDGKKSAEAAAQGMRRIRQQMDSIADSMLRMSEQSQAIGQIIATVEDLAAQSNLLAVNAAIEAAKAGEQGRGFSVVAQEIKNLAEQSRQATNQVRGILSDIRRATSAAVNATEQGSRAVEAGVDQSAQAGESILALATNMAEAAQAATQIAASSQQQSAGMNQIVAAMVSVKQATSQNVTSARELESDVHKLNELGQRLKTLVEEYKA